MKYYNILLLISLVLGVCSCKNQNVERNLFIVKDLVGQNLILPDSLVFFNMDGQNIDVTIPKTKYRIVMYVDSIGCISCKLKLAKWKQFIVDVDSLSEKNTSFLFIFYPKMKKDIFYALKNDNFTYPICLDLENTFYDTNKIPGDMMLQTFLLDEDNKIVAIGNPIHNSKIKDLFLNIISGGQFHPDEKCPQTEVKIDALSMDLGMFDWKKEQKCIFTIQNTGKNLLVIDDINTSCGCTTVEYSKEPVQLGKSIDIVVTYKAEHPEHFNKTITVYCNSESSPLQLKIKGDAK
ncbi:DUF1573 domain-containing protein [Bacteroides hominis]|uniref:DUF1573 domain-containing protein n=1 Tax=Bacteroides hominis TaxID=2763023 RepID=UPI003D6A5D6F